LVGFILRVIAVLAFVNLSLVSLQTEQIITNTGKSVWKSDNIWIKTYLNNKNYYTTINNIVKIENKIKKAKSNVKQVNILNQRLEIQKSKLKLYERNKSFERLLSSFDFEITKVGFFDFVYKDSLKKLNKKIDKLISMKNEFNLAYSILSRELKRNNPNVTDDDVKYFEEFTENIDKTYMNLIETKDFLNKNYNEYYHEKLQKHLVTFFILIAMYIVYKIVVFMIFILQKKISRYENSVVFKKMFSIFFFLIVLVFIVFRYLEDFIYIVTFLSVVAAAIIIALREILLNIIGWVYIFFSNILHVGDRVMVQFETKHTIGDIIDISPMKIKLSEIEDYSNLKEVKNVGRTIYIPNSYIFTKVFYNYSRKKDGLINDLVEFEFTADNDFEYIRQITDNILSEMGLKYDINFTLNNLKTGITALISYQTNYKRVSTIRSELSIALLKGYSIDKNINLKSSKTTKKPLDDGE